MMENLLFKKEIRYLNLLDQLRFPEGKPHIEPLNSVDQPALKKLTLKAGTELKCHQTDSAVTVVSLRGKAKFTANDQAYTMHPGSFLEMPPGTPHGALAESDCVFLVIKAA